MTTPAQRAHIEQVKQRSLERIQQVIALTNQGMTQRAACDKLGLNHYVMSRNIRRWKREQMTAEEAEQDRINLQPKPERNQQMRERFSAGDSLESLSSHYGIHANVCWRIINRNNNAYVIPEKFAKDPEFAKSVEDRINRIWENKSKKEKLK